MNRRSEEVKGFVNFPVDNPDYRNSNEGGLFVRLVVEPRLDGPGELVCSGGYNHVLFDESYLRDDNRTPPAAFTFDETEPPEVTRQKMEDEYKASDSYILHHFPQYKDAIDNIYVKYLSKAYLAVITMGSTGWSGWSESNEEYWHCTYSDLTPEGKAAYDLMKKLYPDSVVTLQTWLDT